MSLRKQITHLRIVNLLMIKASGENMGGLDSNDVSKKKKIRNISFLLIFFSVFEALPLTVSVHGRLFCIQYQKV